MSADRIEKVIELNAPVSRVWKALTDSTQFGEWFRVALQGPFVPGKVTSGHITYPGYEHLKADFYVEKIEPEHLFSLRWHPHAIDPEKDYSKEEMTLVEFKLSPMAKGTLLTLTESGFAKLPAERRDLAFRMNSGGWDEQLRNIEAYVAKSL